MIEPSTAICLHCDSAQKLELLAYDKSDPQRMVRVWLCTCCAKTTTIAEWTDHEYLAWVAAGAIRPQV